MKEYQVIIVGAGVSGSSLGYFLAKEGVNVLILEKEKVPRRKTCAGGVPTYIDQLLGFSIDEVVEQRVKGFILTYCGKEKITFLSHREVMYTVMRDRFDYFLKAKAEEEGAKVFDNQKVVDIEINSDRVKVTTKKDRFTSKILVGADGIGSIVAMKSGLVGEKRRIFNTIQAEVWVDGQILQDLQDRVIFDIGCIPWGAGWVFPKKDHLSIGIGSLKLKLKDLKAYFDNFFKRLNLTFYHIEIESYPIPTWAGNNQIAKGRVLLVGDAASLANPLSGGGITSGIWGAKLASQVITDCLREEYGDLSGYNDLVRKEMAPELNAAYLLSRLIYPFPKFTFHLLLKRRFIKRLWQKREELEGISLYRKLYKYLKLNLFSM